MQLGIVGHARSWYAAELATAADERGHAAHRLEHASLWAGVGAAEEFGYHSEDDAERVAPAELDALIVRTMPPGSLEQVVCRMDLLGRLEAHGVLVVNPPKALECAVDKYLTSARLTEAGVPTPPAVVCESEEVALAAFERLGGDVVVKPLFGSEGRGLIRVDHPDLAFRIFRSLSRTGAVLYVQRFVAHPGYDLRVLLLDNKPLGTYRRHAARDFRTNVSQSGTPEVVRATDEQLDLALRAARATGSRFAGVDLILDQETGEEFVLEVNAVPGWRGFQRLTGRRVAVDVVEWLEQQVS